MSRPLRHARGLALPALWLASTLAVGWWWTRGERVLGQDAFSYVELVKQFADDFPNYFGDWWPFGYPVAGLALFRAGLSAYIALFVVSAASFFAIFAVLAFCLPLNGVGALVAITAVAWSPVSAQLLVFDQSDPLFAASLTLLAVVLARWPHRWAIALAPALALIAFGVRYVGICAFAIVAAFACVRWRELRAQRKLGVLVVSSTLVIVTAAGLLWSNYAARGRITGSPVGHESILSWPVHFADIGLSILAAFSSSHAIQRSQELHPVVMGVAGLAVMIPVVALLVASWFSPTSVYAKPMVLIAAGYILTIVTMRATTPFPSLTYPRYVFPAMFPLVFLAASRYSVAHSRAVAVMGALSIAFSLALAGRGVAAEQRVELEQPRAFLAGALQPGDVVTVNLPARSLAAHFENRFDYVGGADGDENAWTISATNWRPTRTEYTVVGSRGIPGRRVFDPAELAVVDDAVRAGLVEVVFRSDQALIVRARADRHLGH